MIYIRFHLAENIQSRVYPLINRESQLLRFMAETSRSRKKYNDRPVINGSLTLVILYSYTRSLAS